MSVDTVNPYLRCPRGYSGSGKSCECSENNIDPTNCWWWQTYCSPGAGDDPLLEVPGLGHIRILDDDQESYDYGVSPTYPRPERPAITPLMTATDIWQAMVGIKEWVVERVQR